MERVTLERRIELPKAAVALAAEIRGRIIRGELPEGSRLPPEPELMAQLGVSRPTLREALRILESELLVTVRRGSNGGARIQTPTHEVAARYASAFLAYRNTMLADVHDARIAIEPPCAGILARRRDPAALAHLQALRDETLQHMKVKDLEGARAPAQRFHRAVVELAANETLLLFHRTIDEILEQHLAEFQSVQKRLNQPRLAQRHDDHDRLLELIAAGVDREAEACWRAHLEVLKDSMLSGTGNRTVEELRLTRLRQL